MTFSPAATPALITASSRRVLLTVTARRSARPLCITSTTSRPSCCWTALLGTITVRPATGPDPPVSRKPTRPPLASVLRAARALAHNPGPPRHWPGPARFAEGDLHAHLRQDARIELVEPDPHFHRGLLAVSRRDDRNHFARNLPLLVSVQRRFHRLPRPDAIDVAFVDINLDFERL